MIRHLFLDTLVVQSFTVQSNDEVTKRCEKSTAPTAAWQWMPVIGPWCPSNISLIPALLFRQSENVRESSVRIPLTKTLFYSLFIKLWNNFNTYPVLITYQNNWNWVLLYLITLLKQSYIINNKRLICK